MKNAIKVFVVAMTTLAFSGVSFAQAKPAIPATPAIPSAPAMEKKAATATDKVVQKAGDKAEDMSKGKAKGTAKKTAKKTVKKTADKGKDMMDEKKGAAMEKKTK